MWMAGSAKTDGNEPRDRAVTVRVDRRILALLEKIARMTAAAIRATASFRRDHGTCRRLPSQSAKRVTV